MNTNITTTDLAILVLASTAAMLHAGGDTDGAEQLTASLREVDLPHAIEAATAELAARGRLGLGHVLDQLDTCTTDDLREAVRWLFGHDPDGFRRVLHDAPDEIRFVVLDVVDESSTPSGFSDDPSTSDGDTPAPLDPERHPERCSSVSPPVTVTVTEDENGERTPHPVTVRCDHYDGHPGDHRGRLIPPEDEPTTFTWVDHEAATVGRASSTTAEMENSSVSPNHDAENPCDLAVSWVDPRRWLLQRCSSTSSPLYGWTP